MKAIMTGTFDPFTLGHRELAERAVKVFGNVTVAVAAETGKSPASAELRRRIAELSVRDIPGASVEVFGGAIDGYLTGKGECVVVRGLRGVSDCEYERDLSRVYRSLCGVDCVCFITSPQLEHVSSSTVRQLAALGAKLDGYVVPAALDTIKDVYVRKQ